MHLFFIEANYINFDLIHFDMNLLYSNAVFKYSFKYKYYEPFTLFLSVYGDLFMADIELKIQ